MKHRVRLHGKKPKEKSPRRIAKVAKKKLTATDVIKAVRHGAWPTVTQALGEGVDPNHVFVRGDPLIMALATEAPVKIVEAALRAGADPDVANRNRETALFGASDPLVVKALLKADADPLRKSRFGATPLHFQAKAGRSQAMRALLDAGALVDAKNDEGDTPLLLAMRHAHLPAVELLLARGANASQVDRSGEAPLHKIIWQRSQAAVRMAEMLVKAGANLDAKVPQSEFTPLMLAGTPDAVQLLIEAGANVNAVTQEGMTALMRAVHEGDAVSARLLLAAKADASIRVSAKAANRELAGKSPRDVAAASKSKALRDLFR